jgi:hypothetical protein
MKNYDEEKAFNDKWGKMVVINHLINRGFTEITDTNKYDAIDLIVRSKNMIHLIEIKNRHSQKGYGNLKKYGIDEKKYQSMVLKKELIEKNHGLPVLLWYVTLSKDYMHASNITYLKLNNLEIQEIEVQKEYESINKINRKFYQLEVDAKYTKTYPISDDYKKERDEFYGK